MKESEPEGGNSYEVAVHKAVQDAHANEPGQEYWEITKVVVKTGNPHIKEYKVTVAPPR